MTDIYTRLGGRRFLLTAGCALVTTALLWFHRIDGGIFRDIILGTLGIYVSGATAQKFVKPQPEGG